ncbi:thiazole synthase [Saccharibacter floricola]|uniref:Thiazole synthase n=1 Tax=Saccharibacter floricola DSM 15669 TaxID=1123227 RepID=A0ABQ0NWY2_9PROT|nr:thiazole synthase [Saccharibacter floricola]GBQ04923.1 thiazole synthase [Saccharibacter floricola DSM 15669]
MSQLSLYQETVQSRFLLGTARYPSPASLEKAVKISDCDIVTVSLRRERLSFSNNSERPGQSFWSLIQKIGVKVLPNTAGCFSVQEAVTTAHMARELMGTSWIKLEVIGDEHSLHPDVFGLVEAARILTEDGFSVFPYTTTDLGVAERLLQVGCQVLMPWASPIGSGQGLSDVAALEAMRASFPNIPLIVDAGIGRPSQAAEAMEMGFDAVLLNTAVARSGNPIQMALAFSKAIESGHLAYQADCMEPYKGGMASSPIIGKACLG